MPQDPRSHPKSIGSRVPEYLKLNSHAQFLADIHTYAYDVFHATDDGPRQLPRAYIWKSRMLYAWRSFEVANHITRSLCPTLTWGVLHLRAVSRGRCQSMLNAEWAMCREPCGVRQSIAMGTRSMSCWPIRPPVIGKELCYGRARHRPLSCRASPSPSSSVGRSQCS